MKSILGLVVILVILFIAQVSTATEFTGVVSQSMGGTGRAAVVPSEVGLLNPASFVAVQGYTLATAYRDYQTKTPGITRNILVHASENQTDSMFPLAITYLKSTGKNNITNVEREDIHLTTGQTIFGNVAFGLDVARYTFTPEVGEEDSEWDMKIGLLYAPSDSLGFGLVFTNLLQTEFLYLKRGVEFGVNYNILSTIRLALDYSHQIEDNPTDEGILMVGVEHTYFKQVPLRVGFKSDAPISQNYWTLGLGWNGPKLGLDYAFEKNVDETNEYGHSVDLRIYF